MAINLFDNRTTTFAALGESVNAVSVEEALTQGNLNYKVEKKPIYLADGSIIDGQKATVRGTDNHVYGIVSDKYQVVQNEDSFGFIDYMKDKIQFEKVGETKSGMIYLIASLEPMQILGDEYKPHLIFRNSHNGRFQLQTTICPLRIVCQNQFNIAFKESPNTITIRHSLRAEEKLKDAFIVLQGTAEYMKNFNIQAEKWATTNVSYQDVSRIINELFPMEDDMKDFQRERVDQQRLLLRKAFESDDNRNFRSTMWGMINAYSDYITHREPLRKTETSQENNFVAVTFDPTLMRHFIELVNSKIVA